MQELEFATNWNLAQTVMFQRSGMAKRLQVVLSVCSQCVPNVFLMCSFNVFLKAAQVLLSLFWGAAEFLRTFMPGSCPVCVCGCVGLCVCVGVSVWDGRQKKAEIKKLKYV